MRRRPLIDVFKYESFRTFLKDWFAHQKKINRTTFQSLSQKAGFTSPNFFQRLINGTRNLSEESLPKVTEVLGLNKQETEFFSNLVRFNQENFAEKKAKHFKAMARSRRFQEKQPLSPKQCRYFGEWYHPVIHELACTKSFAVTPESIAERLRGKITPHDVTQSLKLMTQLGLLKLEESGHYVQTEPTVTSGAESFSALLSTYHHKVLQWIDENFEKIPQNERDLSALVLGVLPEQIPSIKKRIKDFRAELLKEYGQETSPEEVMILTMYFMPATVSAKTDKEGDDGK